MPVDRCEQLWEPRLRQRQPARSRRLFRDTRRSEMSRKKRLWSHVVAILAALPLWIAAQEPVAGPASNPEIPAVEGSWGPASGPWIAFAQSLTNEMGGFVYGDTERLAERAAIRMCGERGGGECEVEFTLELGCAAVVSGDGKSSWAYVPQSEALAIKSARRDCGQECRVIWSGCTTPRSRRWR